VAQQPQQTHDPQNTKNSLAPRQERSRKTLDLLLQATLRVLDNEGLEACTIPRVAADAGVSPATIYRRFADKDALLRAAFLHVIETNTPNQAGLEKELLRPTLQETAERIVTGLLRQYRTHPHLHRARAQFLETQTPTEFPAQVFTLIAANLQSLAAVLLHHRDRIRHPDPQRAATFAILTATSSIEVIVSGPKSLWQTTLPLSDKQLTAELARALVGYLRRKP